MTDFGDYKSRGPLNQDTDASIALPNAERRYIETKAGKLAVFVSKDDVPQTAGSSTLFFTHGNSSHSTIWKKAFASDLRKKFKLVAFDFPGHGQSDNTSDQLIGETYFQTSYARLGLEVLKALGHSIPAHVKLVGWSMGGHVAIEMRELWENSKSDYNFTIGSILISATPPFPVDPSYVTKGFLPNPLMGIFGNLTPSQEDAEKAVGGQMLIPPEPWMVEAFIRTDGRSRKIMWKKWAEDRDALDQKAAVERWTNDENSGCVVGVVNGEREPFINLEYLKSGINWGKGLWKGKPIEVPDSAHVLWWEAWDPHGSKILEDFAAETP